MGTPCPLPGCDSPIAMHYCTSPEAPDTRVIEANPTAHHFERNADGTLVPASVTWSTALVALATPRGTRYQGVSYVSKGTDSRGNGPLPRGAVVTYRTRLHTSRIEASEQARGRTIHHNLWHDGSGFVSNHLARYCKER